MIEHTNRKGDNYYLHEGLRKDGRKHYYFSKKSVGGIDSIPSGYSVYEKPASGMVYLRKAFESEITDEEARAVDDGITKLSKLPASAVISDIEKRAVVLYVSQHHDTTDLPKILHSGMLGMEQQIVAGMESVRNVIQFPSRPRETQIQDHLIRRGYFDASFKFELDPSPKKASSKRRFTAYRYHFNLEKWWHLKSGELHTLLEKYLPHLGKESYYELD